MFATNLKPASEQVHRAVGQDCGAMNTFVIVNVAVWVRQGRG